MTIDRTSVLGYLAAGSAMAILAVIGVFYVSAGLLAPLWAVVVLMLVWVALVVLGITWFRSHPFRTLVLPVAAVAIWFGLLTFGERVLGWTA